MYAQQRKVYVVLAPQVPERFDFAQQRRWLSAALKLALNFN
jgi:hypothetical protein